MPRLACFCEGLTSQIREKARTELGETEEIKTRSLEELKKLIEDEPEFQPCMEANFLLRFLRKCKYDVEKAFSNLLKHYEFKARYSGIVTDLTPLQLKPAIDQCFYTALDTRAPDDTVVIYICHTHMDMKKISSDEVLATFYIFSHLFLEMEINQITGYQVIMDYANFPFSKAKHFTTLSTIYKIVSGTQNYVPCQIKAFHVVNEPYYYYFFYKIALQFLSEKLKNRIHFHGSDLKSLYKYVPPDILPTELGGKKGPMSNFAKECNARLFSIEEKVAESIKYGYRGNRLKDFQRRNFNMFL